MAPVKPSMLEKRRVACEKYSDVLLSEDMPAPPCDELLAAISTVKGLFNRVVREDQWDWFTVAAQLGYPSRRVAGVIAMW